MRPTIPCSRGWYGKRYQCVTRKLGLWSCSVVRVYKSKGFPSNVFINERTCPSSQLGRVHSYSYSGFVTSCLRIHKAVSVEVCELTALTGDCAIYYRCCCGERSGIGRTPFGPGPAELCKLHRNNLFFDVLLLFCSSNRRFLGNTAIHRCLS